MFLFALSLFSLYKVIVVHILTVEKITILYVVVVMYM